MRKNGTLSGCLPVDMEGFTATQELGRVLLDPNCDDYDIFTPEDRTELLFQLLQVLCLGGALNQVDVQTSSFGLLHYSWLTLHLLALVNTVRGHHWTIL